MCPICKTIPCLSSCRLLILENEVEDLKSGKKPCHVCGELTDGWIQRLFWKKYYCEKHYKEAWGY